MKKYHLKNFGFIALAAMFLLTTTFAQQWVSLNGPYRATNGKDITLGYTGSTRVLYAATDSVRKSVNSGDSWTTIGNKISPSGYITNPLIVGTKPIDANIVITGTYDNIAGNGTIWRSTNSGSTFGAVPSINNQTYVVPLRFGWSLANTQNVFLGTLWNDGAHKPTLRKSPDAGLSWSDDNYFYNTVQTHVRAIAWHPTTASLVYVGGSSIAVTCPRRK